MKSPNRILKIASLVALLAFSSLSNSVAAEKSKYFGAKLIELDALIDRSANKAFTLQLTNTREVVGAIRITKGRNQQTAVEFANELCKDLKAGGEFETLSKPTSGLISNDNSTFKGAGSSNGTKYRYYFRVMKSGLDCYLIVATIPEEFWKTEGENSLSLVDSFKFN